MEYTKERLFNCLDKFNTNYTPTEELVDDIDADMIPIVIELNEKNWITESCCSGHLEQIERTGTYVTYICFSNTLKTFPKNPPRVQKDLGGSYNWFGNRKKSVEENEKERKQLINDLLEWAKSLPVNEDLSGYYEYLEQQEIILNNLKQIGLIC